MAISAKCNPKMMKMEAPEKVEIEFVLAHDVTVTPFVGKGRLVVGVTSEAFNSSRKAVASIRRELLDWLSDVKHLKEGEVLRFTVHRAQNVSPEGIHQIHQEVVNHYINHGFDQESTKDAT